jgi:branched-subunit amino acid permease
VGSFFSCMPITASLSRSLVQETVGGKTQLTSLISCLILLAVMLWIGPFFEPLPRVNIYKYTMGIILYTHEDTDFCRNHELNAANLTSTFQVICNNH